MANRRIPRGLAAAVHVLFVVSLIWSALFLGWISLRTVDFGYPLLYDALAIDRHVARYAPQNRFKHGFENTKRAQRLAIFGEIVDAVHAGGNGLDAIDYTDPRGRSVRFLRPPEAAHLRSVARLIGRLALVSYLMLAGLALTVAAMRAWRLPPPRAPRVAAWTAAVVSAAAVLVLAYGPEDVFNTLHVWVFPAGEQWFFYYQESLMTTLMKAPNLFGAIAVLLLSAGLLYVVLLLALTQGLLRGATPGPG